MDMVNAQAPSRAGFFTRILLNIAGVDEFTLRQCPPADWDNVRAIARIMVFTWVYQTGLFSMIGHRVVGGSGQIRPDVIVISAFIASFILLIDSYMVMRSGWALTGIEELKRGGIDISGGPAARIKAGVFLAVRILLSVALAQLTAICMSLLIFNADIEARTDGASLQANAPIVERAKALIDAEIERATAAVNTEIASHAALSAQVTALRQSDVDPAAGDAQMQQAQGELTGLLAEKAKADEAVAAAQAFASRELGGIPGTGNSGIAGDGARHKAALEQVADAKAHTAEIEREVVAARGRLDGLQRLLAAGSKGIREKARERLPDFESALKAEEVKLTSLQNGLTRLTAGRNDAIRQAVERAPDYVAPNDGLLGQIAALEDIAAGDRKIAAVILLIDVVSFGFELAAVLAKVTAFVPTTYAALLARDAHLQAVRIVDGMMEELEGEERGDAGGFPSNPAPTGNSDTGGRLSSVFGDLGDPAGAPPKRPRGRPRKSTLN